MSAGATLLPLSQRIVTSRQFAVHFTNCLLVFRRNSSVPALFEPLVPASLVKRFGFCPILHVRGRFTALPGHLHIKPRAARQRICKSDPIWSVTPVRGEGLEKLDGTAVLLQGILAVNRSECVCEIRIAFGERTTIGPAGGASL